LQAEFTKLFATIDDNHDEVISLEEFTAYVFGARGAQRAPERPSQSDEERELRAQLAEMQIELLNKQHKVRTQ
jgi:Ca2+-binding EF-hand superfamily protein